MLKLFINRLAKLSQVPMQRTLWVTVYSMVFGGSGNVITGKALKPHWKGTSYQVPLTLTLLQT